MYSKKMDPRTNSRNSLKEIEGTVQGHRDGHGFVIRDDGEADIYIPANEMRAVLHKDRVRVHIVRQDKRGRPEGHIVEIIERPTKTLIGRLLQESGVWLVAPEDKRYGQDVLVPQGATGQAKTGQVVVVELTEAPALFGQPVGRILEVLGEMDDPGMEIEIAVRKYGVPHVFSEACLAAAKALPEKVMAKDRKGRIDLRDVPLCTIDGEDARDFDDAVYCEPAKVGRSKGWRLLVAIADVSHYVQNGNAIDVDAYERATSVYFPRRVIPMLPEKLSNGLCSLNPDVDRLCMVCDMLITAKGEVHAYQFYPGVMHSHARFTYTEVAAILSNTRGPEASQRKERVPDLLNLHGVFRALLEARKQRGAVDFDTVETQIVCDESGRIEKIVPRTRNDAHRLIEECMLAANVCAADFIKQNGRMALFRVHDKPSAEKIDLLRGYLKAIGVNMSVSDSPRPEEFQAIADATKERPDAQQIHTMLLRTMMQAMYTPDNGGHFGLAFDAYTHFTSPIRRYPDLLVHRVIKSILHDVKYKLPQLPVPGEAQEKLAKRLASRVTEPQIKPRSKLAQAELQQLSRLFTKMLLLAEVESGIGQQRFERMAIRTVLQDVLEYYEPIFVERGVQLHTHWDCEGWVMAESHLLANALSNLLDNFLKYGSNTEGLLQLDVRLYQQQGQVILLLRDHGHGVPEEVLPRLGSHFFRASSHQHLPGHGIGLASVRAIMQLHQGSIVWRNASPGLETRIMLPAAS